MSALESEKEGHRLPRGILSKATCGRAQKGEGSSAATGVRTAGARRPRLSDTVCVEGKEALLSQTPALFCSVNIRNL